MIINTARDCGQSLSVGLTKMIKRNSTQLEGNNLPAQ
jgi:hypothetical protein